MTGIAPGRHPADIAYWDCPWPAEDGGPRRLCVPSGEASFGLGPGRRLELLASRPAPGAQMVVRRGVGEFFLLRSDLGRRALRGEHSKTIVERIDPVTLAVTVGSEVLPSGPWWMGGLAVMADGNVTVVGGSWAHRLDGDTLEVLARRRLSAPRPYNSFVAVADGTVVTKDIDRSLSSSCRVHALDPVTLEDRCEPVDIGEPAIARLSADGEDVYVVGRDHVHRLHWDGRALIADRDWKPLYRVGDGRGYGWDPVIAAGRLWFLDQGRHRYTVSMRGSGLDHGPVSFHVIDLADQRNHFRLPVSGKAYGSATNPPLVDPNRMIAVGYDSAGGRVKAWSIPEDPAVEPTSSWELDIDCAPHLLLMPGTGELMLHDHSAPWPLHTRTASRLLDAGPADLLRRTGERFPGLEPKLARWTGGEAVVVVDIATGRELGRADVPVVSQTVCFPAPGEANDAIVTSFTGIHRVGVR